MSKLGSLFKRRQSKIFVIGLSKTGTTSLSEALEVLGYSSIHYPKTFDEIAHYDSASDLFVAVNYQALDKKYPGSKFILTTRPPEPWLESVKRHIDKIVVPKAGTLAHELRVKGLGSAEFDAKKMAQALKDHSDSVSRYFKDRPDDLLIMNMPEDFNWEKLCDFIEKEVPDRPFPRANIKSQDTLKTAQSRDS